MAPPKKVRITGILSKTEADGKAILKLSGRKLKKGMHVRMRKINQFGNGIKYMGEITSVAPPKNATAEIILEEVGIEGERPETTDEIDVTVTNESTGVDDSNVQGSEDPVPP
jgi:hypothetical protein